MIDVPFKVRVILGVTSTARPQYFNGWTVQNANRMEWACGCGQHEQIFYRSNAAAPSRRLSRRELERRAALAACDVFECLTCGATMTRDDFNLALPLFHVSERHP
jgi:hypothetical protein